MPNLSPCARDVFTSSPHRGPDRSTVGGCGPVWYVRGDNLQLQTVTDARGAQTPPETVYRARNPGPRAVITALRADTAAGDGVPTGTAVKPPCPGLNPPARGLVRTAWPAGPECTRKDRPKHTHTYTTPAGGWTGATRRLAHGTRTRPGGVTPTQPGRQRGGACSQDRNRRAERRAPEPQNRVTMYSWESRTVRLELDGPARM